jgi:hypothetical protein
MIKQIVTVRLGLAFILVFEFLTIMGLQTTEAFEWWKPFKYEKWNCCNNTNFKPIPIQESNSNNEIIQNIEVNQICERAQICLIDLHDLNSQLNYSDR